jgi:hypothetical protein
LTAFVTLLYLTNCTISRSPKMPWSGLRVILQKENSLLVLKLRYHHHSLSPMAYRKDLYWGLCCLTYIYEWSTKIHWKL